MGQEFFRLGEKEILIININKDAFVRTIIV
jgi:hypothetical protein